MKTCFYLLLFSALFSACRFIRYKNENGEYRPKSEKFFSYKKANTRVSDTLLVDTNAIYVMQLGKLYAFDTNDVLVDSINNAWQYMRFYATGQVYFSHVFDTLPSVEKVNSQTRGIIGYYKFDNKNRRIKIQYLNPYLTNPQTYFGKFDGGDILIYTLRPETFWNIVPYNSKTDRWKKVKLEGMKYIKPDW